jgi:hypothetical protein
MYPKLKINVYFIFLNIGDLTFGITLVYIGQTGRNLNTRYKEHIRSIRCNKEDSAFAQHILNTGHQYGPVEQIIELIKLERAS